VNLPIKLIEIMNKNKLYTFTHYITYLTVIHGSIYGIYKYFLKVESEYGLRPHQMQGVWQGVHIFLSPLLIFIFGILFKEHIVKMYKSATRKRKTGLSLVFLMIAMILSGYLIQIIYAKEPKVLIAYIHIAVSFLFGFFYLIHHLLKR